MTTPQPRSLYFTEDVPHVTRAITGAVFMMAYSIYPNIQEVESGLAESWACFGSEQRTGDDYYTVEDSAMEREWWVVGDYGFSCPQRAFFGRTHDHPVVIQQFVRAWYLRREERTHRCVLDLQVHCLCAPYDWGHCQRERTDDSATLGNDIEYMYQRIRERDQQIRNGEVRGVEVNTDPLLAAVDTSLESYGVGLPDSMWRQFDPETLRERHHPMPF